MKSKIMFFFMIIFLLSGAAMAVNPKSIESMTVKIYQGGDLNVNGYIETANLTVYVPQEGVRSTKIDGVDSWSYIFDEFGNRKLLLEWVTPKKITYTIETTVSSKAKHTPFKNYRIGNNRLFLNTTKSVDINDDIREMAYPYEKTLERAAELTSFVHDYMTYDISLGGARKSSSWTLENKRGVCVEHANLLASLLRANGIPTRYVVGYAFSDIDKKLIGHTWVEVLAVDDNGKEIWIPFDPTWHQGGYLDASHIKTSNLLDDNQLELLTYKGTGTIEWKRHEETVNVATANLTRDRIDIIDIVSRNMTSIKLSGTDTIAKNNYGYIKAVVSTDNECMLNSLKVNSCVDNGNILMLDIYSKKRNLWICGPADLYWIFSPISTRENYICPVQVYDDIGSMEKFSVTVEKESFPYNITIKGPDSVAVNEEFSLKADVIDDFLFFSPNLTAIGGKKWTMSLNKPGTYIFYLYSNNNIAVKNVAVSRVKQFSLNVDVQRNVSYNESFLVSVSVNSLIDTAKKTKIKLEMDDNVMEKNMYIKPRGSETLVFNITSHIAGKRKIVVSSLSDTLSSYTTSIDVYGTEEKGFIDGIIKMLADFFSGLGIMFGG